MGLPPKQNRQRHGAPARGDWVRLAPLEGPVIPELDEFSTNNGEPWSTLAYLMWESWMEDPATKLWNKGDIAFAVQTIQLVSQSSVNKSAEIRLRMESLGLTPKGRVDRRLLLPNEEEPASDPTPTPPRRDLPEAV